MTVRPSGRAHDRVRMVRHINAGTLWSLPEWSMAPKGLTEQLQTLAAQGVVAVQHPFPDALDACPLPIAGMGRVDRAADADRIAARHKAAGYLSTTLHVGSGLESDDEIDRLVSAIIEAGVRHGHPMLVETHRATVTQDIRRTLDMVTRLPEVRFTADLSHWYTGQEMAYGDFTGRLDRLAPVFERVRYIHGRIGSPCCMQVALAGAADERSFVQHYRELWQRCAAGFLATAEAGEVLPFAPELLPHSIRTPEGENHLYYARCFDTGDGNRREESDRWTQAAYLWEIAEAAAQAAGLAVAGP